MKAWKQLLLSFCLTLAVWVLFSWPLPKYFSSGISSSSMNTEKGNVRAMIPGDHLQFLYQFWLADDTLKGRTPAFKNVYEFNFGDDEARSFRGTYYVPFSLFYAAGAAVGGRAAGYNFDQFLVLWITFLFTWLLVRRYNRNDYIAMAAAVIAITLPYPWISMLDGSPTGLGMMLVPLIFWALDIMIAERRLWAAAVAGIGICLAESDTHIFFFVLLASPFWCLFSYLFHFPGKWPSWKEVRSVLVASVPLLLFLGLALFQAWSIRQGIQHTTLADGGRPLGEIDSGSPSLSGLLRLEGVGEGRRIYLGGYIIAVLFAGALAYVWSRFRGNKTDQAVPLVTVCLLILGMVGLVLLSSGVKNPAGPGAWKLFMKLVPPYAMIRQPHKIYCLMPVVLALTFGVLVPYLLYKLSPRMKILGSMALVVPLLFDYGRRIDTTVCLLDKKQGAFEAVAFHSEKAGNAKPQALSLPLWPGDSHYDSLNEHYASLYRIRMVNGYGGSVKQWFWDDVFLPLESMNMGSISDAQLDLLLARGVRYIVFHEDCFPEKVSPFPVAATLHALLSHPRLIFLERDGSVWAFSIESAGSAVSGKSSESLAKYMFPSKKREFERCSSDGAPKVVKDQGAVYGAYLNLASEGQVVRVAGSLAPMDPGLVWFVRARGQGKLTYVSVVDGADEPGVDVDVSSGDWKWVRLAVAPQTGAKPVSARFAWKGGTVDLDSAMLAAGEWDPPRPGGKIEIPAASFFHAGYTDDNLEAVVLRKDYEQAEVVFYGPGLPLEAGLYTAELIVNGPDAPDGTVLGTLQLRTHGGGVVSSEMPVVNGSKTVVGFGMKDNKPFSLAFRFARVADVRIERVVISRIE